MRRVILLIFSLIITFTTTSCTSVSNTDTEHGALSKQIEELQAAYEELQKLYEEVQNELNDSNSANLELQSQIDYLNNKIYNLTGTPVVFTAESPKVGKPEKHILFVEFNHRDDASISFEAFADYCEANFGLQNDFCLLKPIYDDYDFHPSRTRYYAVYVEGIVNGVPVNPFFEEQIMLYSGVLGDGGYQDPDDDGAVPWSIELKTFFVPIVDQIETNTIHLEFGNDSGDKYFPYYINIYIGNVCVGTSYYRVNTYISQRWFQSYYRSYLLKYN